MSKLGYVLGLLSIPCILTAGTVACLTYIKEWNEPSFKKSEMIANESLSTEVSDISESPSIEMLQIPDIKESTEVFEDETIDDIPFEEIIDESNLSYTYDKAVEENKEDWQHAYENFKADVEENGLSEDFVNNLDNYYNHTEEITNDIEKNIGETYTSDGQYSFTLNSISRSGKEYMIEYTYTNLGYKDESKGLIFDESNYFLSDGLYDANVYYTNEDRKPRYTQKGETCTVSAHLTMPESADNANCLSVYITYYKGSAYIADWIKYRIDINSI